MVSHKTTAETSGNITYFPFIALRLNLPRASGLIYGTRMLQHTLPTLRVSYQQAFFINVINIYAACGVLGLHEEKKFEEWAKKVEEYTTNKDRRLKDACQRLVHWANKIKERDSDHFNEKVRDTEISLISKAVRIVYDEYLKTYLLPSKKHGRFTKIRLHEIGRFIHYFTSYLIPLAEEIGDKNFLRKTVQTNVQQYMPDLFYNLPDLDEYHIQALLKFLTKAEELNIPNTSLERAKVEAEILNRQLEDTANRDTEESYEVEFKERLPDDPCSLAKEIAAFASTKGGRIYIGIKDNGGIIGIVEDKTNWFDKLQLRIDDIAANGVQPSHQATVHKYFVGTKVIVQIGVPKGSEPVYYVGGVPYTRKMTKSRPAKPAEVKQLHFQYFINSLKNSVG
jgi:hypothetical protein